MLLFSWKCAQRVVFHAFGDEPVPKIIPARDAGQLRLFDASQEGNHSLAWFAIQPVAFHQFSRVGQLASFVDLVIRTRIDTLPFLPSHKYVDPPF